MKLLVTKQVTKAVIDSKATGLNAAKVRKAKGWSYRDTAAALCCSASYLSDLEKGHRAWTGHIGQTYLKLLEKP